MNDERLVCDVDGDALRFHWSHHPESSWSVDIISGDPDDERATFSVLERALDENEVDALLDSHLARLYAPREFKMEASPWDLMGMIVWLAVGVWIGLFLYGFVTELVL